MDSLNDLIKIFQKQNQAMQAATALTSINSLASAITNQKKQLLAISSVNGLTEIAKMFSKQFKSFDKTKVLIDNSVLAHIANTQKLKLSTPFTKLTSTLAEIAKKNQTVSNNLSAFASSQIVASNNLVQIANAISQSHLNKFNSIDIALKGISKSFLNDVSLSQNWEDISIAEKATEVISNVTEELLVVHKPLTVNDLDELKKSIVSKLFGLLGKTKTEKARQYLFDLIALIGFLLTLYGTYVQHSDKSNNEVIQETKREIEKLNKEFSHKIEQELNKLNKTRTTIRNNNLYFSAKKKSRVIGVVKNGQQVTVIEIRHKYLLISYIDQETNEPKSGFVIKKYYECD